jgi:hypothetical protein
LDEGLLGGGENADHSEPEFTVGGGLRPILHAFHELLVLPEERFE